MNQSESTITFDGFIKYAHWKYTPYCCDVNIQRFVANIECLKAIGILRYIAQFLYLLPVFPSSLDVRAYNIQDHGEYHENIS
jgi:hypothetical protein